MLNHCADNPAITQSKKSVKNCTIIADTQFSLFMENSSQTNRINNNEVKILIDKGDWTDVMYSELCKALN